MTETVDVVAVASRSTARAAAQAVQLGIARAHGSYEALLDDPDVDAVYVSLPNSLHVEWAIRALECGKHVLCEKPFSSSAGDVRRAFAVAAASDRLLMEAFMWRHTALGRRLVELVRGGALGRPALFAAVLTNDVAAPTDPRFSAELEGGALMDLGCYAVHVFRQLFGEPVRFSAQAVGAPVDTRFAAGWVTADGTVGQVSCGFGLAHQWELRVIGDGGWLVMPDRWTRPPARIELHTASGTTSESFDDFDPYRDQLDGFARTIAGVEPPLLGERDAVAQAAALQALHAAIAR